ncbi:hypothetical protein [Sphingomonas koreensis]
MIQAEMSSPTSDTHPITKVTPGEIRQKARYAMIVVTVTINPDSHVRRDESRIIRSLRIII